MEFDVYHGRTATDPTFDLKYVGSENAIDQYGSGFYFTDSLKEAAGYAAPNGIIIHAKITIKRELNDKRKASPREIAFMIQNGDKEMLDNFDENRARAFKQAVEIYSDHTAMDAMHTIARDFYRDNAKGYLENLTKLKYDGSIHATGDLNAVNDSTRNRFVIFSPKNIKVLDIIPYSEYQNTVVESEFVGMLGQLKDSDPTLIENVRNAYVNLFEAERVGGKRLNEYPRYSVLSRVTIYRAQIATSSILEPDSYVTLSPKFAIEHAENNHIYTGEPHIVVRAVVNPKDVADASNPGEYFYKGQPIQATVAYRTLGDEFDTESIPDITKTIMESESEGMVGGGRRIKYVPFTKVDYRLKMWEWLRDNKKNLSEEELEKFKKAYATLMDSSVTKVSKEVLDLFNSYEIPYPSQQIEYVDEPNVEPERSVDERFSAEYMDALNKILGVKSMNRSMIPKFRGITMDKIKKHLKSHGRSFSNIKMASELSKFDSADELREHMYYHGSGTSMSVLKPGAVLPKDSFRGGGYEDMQHTISLSKSKQKASVFTGEKRTGTVFPVLLRKNSRVIDMSGKVQDAMDLEEFLPKLWEANIDAVWIGGGEEELVVLNPRSIVLGKGESFGVYGSPQFTNDDAIEFARSYGVELT